MPTTLCGTTPDRTERFSLYFDSGISSQTALIQVNGLWQHTIASDLVHEGGKYHFMDFSGWLWMSIWL